MRISGILAYAALGAVLASAQSNITLNLTSQNGTATSSHTLISGQTGSVGSLGYAALAITGSSVGVGNGVLVGPANVTFQLAFNEADTIAISFSPADPNFAAPTTVALTGGTITGGTGVYAGATGSLDLTIVKDSDGAFWSQSTTSGSGTVTAGGKTIPLTLSNFRGWCCGWGTREEDYRTVSFSVSGTLGNGSAVLSDYYYLADQSAYGSGTITFNSSDSLNIVYNYDLPTPGTQATFNGLIAGGTGKYTTASGTLTISQTGPGLKITGTMTTNPPGGPVITSIKTAFGLPQVAGNTWLQINGTNLVPKDTPPAGVDWSNAPDFASGRLPTQLGPISVNFPRVNDLSVPRPAYIYYYCSAATNPNCSSDQINVLAPLNLPSADPSPFQVSVTNNGITSAPFLTFLRRYAPAFFVFDLAGHVAARHLDASLVGPASLYPGSSTPAKAGETISLYGTGFGPVSGNVEGSATQSGSLSNPGLSCWISGLSAQAQGALVSPGLYQINLTIPKGVPSGDDPVLCIYNFYTTTPGSLIAVQ